VATTVEIQAGPHTVTAARPLPDAGLRDASTASMAVPVRTNVAQARKRQNRGEGELFFLGSQVPAMTSRGSRGTGVETGHQRLLATLLARCRLPGAPGAGRGHPACAHSAPDPLTPNEPRLISFVMQSRLCAPRRKPERPRSATAVLARVGAAEALRRLGRSADGRRMTGALVHDADGGIPVSPARRVAAVLRAHGRRIPSEHFGYAHPGRRRVHCADRAGGRPHVCCPISRLTGDRQRDGG
jgi:hypothetical protein